MKVRSVTYFARLTYPFDEKRIAAAGTFLRSARQSLEAAGLETQTLRLATTPFTQVLGDPTATQVVDMAQALEGICAEGGIDFVSIGPVMADRPDAALEPIHRLPDVLSRTERVFATVALASAERGVNLAAVQASAEAIREVSRNTPKGFGTLRFAALANCPPGSPFFPIAYHDGGPDRFAFATQAADLATPARRPVSVPPLSTWGLTASVVPAQPSVRPSSPTVCVGPVCRPGRQRPVRGR
jgi:uncharacterized protein (UPF0210 family)